MTSAEAIGIPNAQREMFPVQVRDPSMAPLEAEKRLMLAVLERAVNDFRTYAIVPTGRGRGLFMEVAAWFHSSTTGPFPAVNRERWHSRCARVGRSGSSATEPAAATSFIFWRAAANARSASGGPATRPRAGQRPPQHTMPTAP